jgi:hypothetical protein
MGQIPPLGTPAPPSIQIQCNASNGPCPDWIIVEFDVLYRGRPGKYTTDPIQGSAGTYTVMLQNLANKLIEQINGATWSDPSAPIHLDSPVTVKVAPYFGGAPARGTPPDAKNLFQTMNDLTISFQAVLPGGPI